MTIKLLPVPRRPKVPAAPLLATVVWGGLVAVSAFWGASTGHDSQLCPFHRLTGLPCPGCGSTRAVLSLLHGDVAGAFVWNPLIMTALLLGLLVLLLRLAAGRKLEIRLGRRHKQIVLTTLIVCLAANWAYVLIAGR